MKRIALTALAAVMMTGTASAQTVTNTITFGLDANVPLRCAMGTASATVDFDFNNLADTDPAASVAQQTPFDIACNDPDGASMTYTSTNGGFLLRNGGTATDANDVIPYRVNATVYNNIQLNIPPLSNLTTVTKSVGGSTQLREGTSGFIKFAVSGVDGGTTPRGVPTTTVFSGDYTDTFVMSLSAN